MHIVQCACIILRKAITKFFLPGNFLVRNDALVMQDLDNGAVDEEGVKAILIPIGPSLGCPKRIQSKQINIKKLLMKTKVYGCF